MYQIRDLRVKFPGASSEVLEGVNFTVHRGDLFALAGETGSGKTTILRAMSALLPRGVLVSGEIRAEGKDLLRFSEKQMRKYRREEMGVVLQNTADCLDPLLTVGEHLRLASERKMSREEMGGLLRRFGLHEGETLLGYYPFQLSGGMKQRLLIASSSLSSPKLLILDEPTKGLDARRRREIAGEIRRLHRQEEVTILLVTHDLDLAFFLSNRMAVLYRGKIVEEGETKILMKEARSAYLKSLLSVLRQRRFQPEEESKRWERC
ncbi:MAG: ATP-binding cassette domain-containing protein [Peptostreptococcaceae bacterium]|nr:ATP-binding cassette domain-containing protein [Peptostreptococcaceae bacterium]